MEFLQLFGELGITSWLCLMDFVYICRRSVSQQWAWLLERVDGSQRELWQYHGASLHGGQIGWEGRRERYHGEERIGRAWQTSIALGFCRWEHNYESQKNTKVARTYNETQLFEVCGFNLKSCWYNGFVWGSALGLDNAANKRTWSGGLDTGNQERALQSWLLTSLYCFAAELQFTASTFWTISSVLCMRLLVLVGSRLGRPDCLWLQETTMVGDNHCLWGVTIVRDNHGGVIKKTGWSDDSGL